MLEKILEWDRETFIYLNNLGLEEYDQLWSTITDFRTWIPLYLFFFYLFFKKFRLKKAFAVLGMLLLMVFVVTTVTDLTKEVVARLRPNNDDDINTLIRIVKSPTTYSFFSGHAASSVSITTLVCLFLRTKWKWVWILYFWPLLMITSRIYVGVHFPVDLIVGTLVGLFFAFLTYYLYDLLIVPYLGLDHP